MNTQVIQKKDIPSLLKELTSDWDTYVPLRNLGDDVWFELLPKKSKELDIALERVALGDEDVIVSAKDLFFPQLESMFEFKNDKARQTPETSKKLLFGIKACDLKGILFCDEFFKRDFDDIYYLSRIRRRFIVVIGCIKPPRPNACFCTSAKTGPFAEGGYDLQLIDAGDSYLTEVGSSKGEEFVSKYKKFLKDSSAGAKSFINRIKTESSKRVELKIDFPKALSIMADDGFIPEENYKRVGERCIYCGACLYTCPTCTCFNVFDNTKDGESQRLRNWDGCVFEGYTREASGHNPRKDKWLRASRRYEHKLKYDYKLTGSSGCVGCGRCLSSCPVDIGISKFIQEITEDRKVM